MENAFTLEGRILHEAADSSGYDARPGVRAVRALPLYSDRLGLTGKADVVEFGTSKPPYPVEFKRGKRNRWINDDVQLCAQALCLEEMLGQTVPRGAIFHVSSRRRREVEFTPRLREETQNAIKRLHSLISLRQIPRAILKPQCEGCSLHEACVPELSVANRGTVSIFEID